jgi:hypothetical protein
MTMRRSARALIGVVVLVAAAIGLFIVLNDGKGSRRVTDAPPSNPAWVALFTTDRSQPRVVDLCDDEQAAGVFGRNDLEEDRRKYYIECDDPRAIRYAGVIPRKMRPAGNPPLFRPQQVDWAQEWIANQKAAIEAAKPFEPRLDDFFKAAKRDANGCTSQGLKKIPRQAHSRASAKADIDGDGRTDRVAYYVIGEWPGAEPHMRLEFGNGTVIDDSEDVLPINSLFGPADFDSNDRQELWIEVNSNKPLLFKLYLFDQCQFREVEGEGDGWFGINMYGRVAEDHAAECTDSRIVYMTSRQHIPEPHGEGSPDIEEGWFFRVYRLEGMRMVEVERGSGDDLDERPSRFNWEGSFECSDLVDEAR